jgi:hypothetical protein
MVSAKKVVRNVDRGQDLKIVSVLPWHGGDSTDYFMDLINDIDTTQPFVTTDSSGQPLTLYTPAEPLNAPKVKTPWTFRSGVLKIQNPGDTFAYTFVAGAITANVTVNIPVPASGTTLNMATLEGANTFTSTLVVNKSSQASVAEEVASFQVSDSVGYLKIHNNLTTNAIFVPRIMGHNATTTATANGLVIDAYFSTGGDTGAVPVMVFRSVQSNGAALVNRQLFSFQDFNTVVAAVNANGDFTHTIKAQTSVGEVLGMWTVGDQTSGYIQFRNASTATAEIIPWILANSITGATTYPGLYVYANIPTANDSGTTPAIVLDGRLATAVRIATRPLFGIRNMLTDVMKVNANGDALWNITAQASVAEVFATWQKSDDATGFLQFINSTTAAARFAPMILARTANVADVGLWIDSRVSTDTGTEPGMVFISRTSGFTALATRPAFQFKSGIGTSTPLISIDGKGAITQIVTAQAAISEVLQVWKTSDTPGSGGLTFMNASGTDAQFIPSIWGRPGGAGAANVDLYLMGQCEVGEDSGTAPAVAIDGRIVNAGLVTRPIFQVRTFAVAKYTFYPASMDFHGNSITNVLTWQGNEYGSVPTTPAAAKYKMWADSTDSGRLKIIHPDASVNPAELWDGVVTDVKIATHTTTKISTTSKSLLNSQIAYKDETGWLTSAMVSGTLAKTALIASIAYEDEINTFTTAQILNSYFNVKSRAAPTTPAATYISVFLDSADDRIKALHSDASINPMELYDGAVTDAKIATHTTTKITITDKTKLNTQIAYKDELNWLSDAMVLAHTSTKITIAAKAQLPATIPHTDQTNTFGAFDQIFTKGNFKLDDTASAFFGIFTTSTLTADRTYTFPNLSGIVCMPAVDNAFTALQTFTLNADTVVNLRRPLVTNGTLSGLQFNLYSGTTTYSAYAAIRAEIVDNTAVTFDGSLNFYTAKEGVLIESFSLTNEGAQDLLAITAPAGNPAAGWNRMYVDVADDALKIKKSSGTVVNLESVGVLDSLTDVVITTPAATQILAYNGTNWVNTPASAPGAHRTTHISGGADSFIKGDDLVASTLYLQDIADPASDAQRIWIEDATANLKYWSDEGSPVKHTVERQANKNIASGYAGLDAGSRIAKAQDVSTSVYTDQANAYGDFAQTFHDDRLVINNPAGGAGYVITAGAIAATRILNLPVITGTDTLVVTNLAQTLLAKTLTSPTINTPTMSAQVITDYEEYNEVATPSNPAANKARLYMHSTDEHLKVLHSDGSILDLEAPSGVNQYADNAKYGVWDASTTIDSALGSATGLIAGIGLTVKGTASQFSATEGKSYRHTSAALANDSAGVRGQLLITNRTLNAKFRCKFLTNTVANTKFYIGWWTDIAANPTGDDPLLSKQGIWLGKRNADTTFQIGKNDGTGSTVYVNTGITPVVSQVYTIEIIADAANNRWGWSIDGAAYTYETTEIPDATTGLTFCAQIENGTTAARQIDIYFIRIASDK